MKEDVLASAGAQDVESSGYELSELEDIKLFWENPQVEWDAVFRPRIGTLFSPTAFNDLEMGVVGSSEYHIVLAEEKDKAYFPEATSMSERLTEPTRLLKSHLFGRRIENMTKFVCRILFE